MLRPVICARFTIVTSKSGTHFSQPAVDFAVFDTAFWEAVTHRLDEPSKGLNFMSSSAGGVLVVALDPKGVLLFKLL